MAVRRRNGQATPGEGSKVRTLDVYADDWSCSAGGKTKVIKAGRGKGMKKELLPFDFINVVGSNPAPFGRVDILRKRFEKGLDLWTGNLLKHSEHFDNVDEIVQEIIRDDTPEKVIDDQMELLSDMNKVSWYSPDENYNITDDSDDS